MPDGFERPIVRQSALRHACEYCAITNLDHIVECYVEDNIVFSDDKKRNLKRIQIDIEDGDREYIDEITVSSFIEYFNKQAPYLEKVNVFCDTIKLLPLEVLLKFNNFNAQVIFDETKEKVTSSQHQNFSVRSK